MLAKIAENRTDFGSRRNRIFRMNRINRIPVGKLPPEHLARLLGQVPATDPRVVLAGGLGEDAAVIEMGDRYLVAKTDPVTFAIEKIGWYAVHVNANDVAVLGAAPRWFLATLLLPDAETTAPLVDEIFADILAACGELGVTLCGGHTEITYGIERPVVVGQMLGEVSKPDLLRKDSLTPGDVILLTRGVAIEGTAVIAREKSAELSGKVSEGILKAARGFLFDPGISVVRAARIAAGTGMVKAMHDPTEGGVLAGLLELACAARLGIRVFAEEVAVLPETRAICSVLGLNPLYLLASGALLIGLPGERADEVIETLKVQGIETKVVAEMLPARQGRWVRQRGQEEPLCFPERDELAKLF